MEPLNKHKQILMKENILMATMVWIMFFPLR